MIFLAKSGSLYNSSYANSEKCTLWKVIGFQYMKELYFVRKHTKVFMQNLFRVVRETPTCAESKFWRFSEPIPLQQRVLQQNAQNGYVAHVWHQPASQYSALWYSQYSQFFTQIHNNFSVFRRVAPKRTDSYSFREG